MQYPGNIKPGEIFGSLKAIRFIKMGEDHYARWEFLCACGSVTVRRASTVKQGKVLTCGCSQTTLNGMYNTTEYTTWKGIIARCYNKNNPNYSDYGGRGIVMSDTWRHSFINFYNDMGPKPLPIEKFTIDRTDVNGNYCKENCAWVTWDEQAANRRNNVRLMYKGKLELQYHVAAWIGIHATRVSRFMGYGLTGDEIEVYVNSNKKWNIFHVDVHIYNEPNYTPDFNHHYGVDKWVVVGKTMDCVGNTKYTLVVKGKRKEQ